MSKGMDKGLTPYDARTEGAAADATGTGRRYTGPYRVTLLGAIPTGVEHMGAVEAGSEPVLQRVTDSVNAERCVYDVIGVASHLATEDSNGTIYFAFDRRQHVYTAVGDLTSEGGRVLLGYGYHVLVERVTWRAIYDAIEWQERYLVWEPEWDDHGDALDAYNAHFGSLPSATGPSPSAEREPEGLPNPEPPPYTGDEPLGCCPVHGDYWTDECIRCGR